MISQETIEEVKRRASLIDIVGEQVSLRRQGGHFVGLCPFHAEKTPSFSVKEDGSFYYCFGCGASGGVIRFAMESRALSFPEAVRYLAERAGIEVKLTEQSAAPTRAADTRRLFELNLRAKEFFDEALLDAPKEVKEYLASRGLNAALCREFAVGFAPPGWRSLHDHLHRSFKATDEELLNAGLARRSERGEVYDLFRGRITFGVLIDRGRVAGFGGRLVPSLVESAVSFRDASAAQRMSEGPKYLNTPETEAYKKSQVLYALPWALQAIRGEKQVFVVEGYFDAVTLHRLGVRNVVATCGTALTQEHVRRLARVTSRVNLLFDGDSAGERAAGRVYPSFINSGIDAAALFLPQGEDPDTFAEANKADLVGALRRLPSKSLFECHLKGLIEAHGFAGAEELGSAAKGTLAEEVLAILSKVESPIEQQDLCGRAALLLRLDQDQLQRLLLGKHRIGVKTEDKQKGVFVPKGNTFAAPRGDGHSQPARSEETGVKAGPLPGPGEKGLESAAAGSAELSGTPSGAVRMAAELSRLDRELLLLVMAGRQEFCVKVLHDPDFVDALSPAVVEFIASLSQALSGSDEATVKAVVKQVLFKWGGGSTSTCGDKP